MEERFLFPSYPLSYVYCVCSVGYISGRLCSGANPTKRSGFSSPPTHSVMCIGVQCGLYLWLAVFWRRSGFSSPPTRPVMCIVCAVWTISLAGCVLEPAPQGVAVPLPLLPTQSCVLVWCVGYISGLLCSGGGAVSLPLLPAQLFVLVCSVGSISGWLCSGGGAVSLPLLPAQSCALCVQCGLYLWLVVFWSQPHKEERFPFPSYPLSHVYWCAVWAISLAG